MSSGLRSARSPGDMCAQCVAVTVAKTSGNAIVSRIPTPSDQRVERRETNFVHSESATRACVTRPRAGRRGIETWIAALLMPPAPAVARRLEGPVLHLVARQLHECLLQRRLQRRQLVQDDAVRGRDLADVLRRDSADLE